MSNSASGDDRIAIAWDACQGKSKNYSKLFRYYDGAHQLTYTNARLKAVFKGFVTNFQSNWCGVVVDAVLDRLQLVGSTVPNADSQVGDPLTKLWERSSLDNEQRMVHEAALVTGEGVLVVGEGDDGAEAYYNDPSSVHVEYSGEKPRDILWACKFWTDEAGLYRATVYTPEMVERFATNSAVSGVTSSSAFKPESEEVNTLGEIPVFHFTPEHRILKSDLKSVVPLQNAVNKLLADMMVSAEFGAFKQRYVIGKMAGDSHVTKLKNKPGEVWGIPDPTASVGELSATDLQNYIQALEQLINQIGAISRTPRHFFLHTTSQQPSGEALIAQEAPLNARVGDRVRAFTPAWRRALRLMATIDHVSEADILQPVWKPVETMQPLTEATVLKTLRDAGMPLTAAMRQVGYTQAEIDEVKELVVEEALQRRETLEAMAQQAQGDFDNGTEDLRDE